MSKSPVSYRRNAARFIRLLMQRDMSMAELAEKTPMDYERVRCFIHDLKAEGVVHICGWRRDSNGRMSIALYALGMGVDATKPKAKTSVERTRKYKQKQDYVPLRKAPTTVRAPISVFDLGSRLCSAPSAAPTHESLKPEPVETA